MGRPANKWNNYYCCVDFWATFVKQLPPCYQTVVCPVYLSLTLVYCGEMVEWIRMPLGMEVGLGPGHIVLNGELGPGSPLKKGGRAQPSPLFGPCLLWPNGWMDQDVTWYRDRSRPRPHCVTWRPNSPAMERGTATPTLLAHVYCRQTVAMDLSCCWALVLFVTQMFAHLREQTVEPISTLFDSKDSNTWLLHF